MTVAIIAAAAFVICVAILMIRYLVKSSRRASLLLNVSMELSSSMERKTLLEKMMAAAAKALQAEGSSVLLVDEKTGELYFEVATGERHEQVKQIRLQPGEGVAGYVAATRQPLLIPDAGKDERWSARVADKVKVATRNMLCVPVVSADKLLGVLQVINKQGGKTFRKQDLRLLEMLASPAAIALENMLLYEALLESMENLRVTTAAKQRMESEMLFARQIQQSFLPQYELAAERVQLSAQLIPAREVGGDFFYYTLLDERTLLLCLGDVSDKGMPAALFLSGLMIWIKAKAREWTSPAAIMQAINEELSTEDSTMFATIFLASFNLDTGRLVYCNGGHCPPIWLSNGEARLLSGDRNLPIGVIGSAQYVENVAQITEQDTLVFYTDGITEALNTEKQLYGTERLYELLSNIASAKPEQLNEHLINDVRLFCGGQPQADDIAVMSIAYLPAAQKEADRN
ncbi:PP2C family protein-serine/threonine phosphatase [Paenibacillus sp. GXUN7292]|uniref:PP2C family protein-serine/threonine phosphatase n=1 Tax=Paenibacillus sp. GXUN7292 TaxID=3422499 RepID=UPI003374102E